jgi:hypothetical protein
MKDRPEFPHGMPGMEDTDDAAAEVREGYAAIKRGEYIDISGDDELRGYFDNARERAKKELAAPKRLPTAPT